MKKTALTRLARVFVNRQVAAVLGGPGSPEGKVLELHRDLQREDRRIFIEEPPALPAHATRLVQESDGSLVVYLDPSFLLNRKERHIAVWEEVYRQLSQTVVCVIDPAQLVVQEIAGRLIACTAQEFEVLSQG